MKNTKIPSLSNCTRHYCHSRHCTITVVPPFSTVEEEEDKGEFPFEKLFLNSISRFGKIYPENF